MSSEGPIITDPATTADPSNEPSVQGSPAATDEHSPNEQDDSQTQYPDVADMENEGADCELLAASVIDTNSEGGESMHTQSDSDGDEDYQPEVGGSNGETDDEGDEGDEETSKQKKKTVKVQNPKSVRFILLVMLASRDTDSTVPFRRPCQRIREGKRVPRSWNDVKRFLMWTLRA